MDATCYPIAAAHDSFICPNYVMRCCELFHRHPEVVARLLDRLLALVEADAAKQPQREF